MTDVKAVACSCGYVASGATGEDLLADVEAHVAVVHATETLRRPESRTRAASRAVRTYLAEAYLARSCSGELGAIADRVRSVARELTAGGIPIHHLRSTFIPEDETCLHLFEATSAESVSEAITRAGIGEVRVVEAIREETRPRPVASAHREFRRETR